LIAFSVKNGQSLSHKKHSLIKTNNPLVVLGIFNCNFKQITRFDAEQTHFSKRKMDAKFASTKTRQSAVRLI
jgi:hypothetical protein